MSADLVRARIDEGPVVPLMWLVVCLGFLLNLADGIDVVAMSVTAPSVAASYHAHEGKSEHESPSRPPS